MSAIRIAVTAEHCEKAGAWPTPPAPYDPEWANPVELAIEEASGVNVDIDGDEDGWHATIGPMEGSTLVVDLPEIVNERLNPYYAQPGLLLEPFDFEVELDAWLVALLAKAATTLEQAEAVIASEATA
jgi:hypothetical protein